MAKWMIVAFGEDLLVFPNSFCLPDGITKLKNKKKKLAGGFCMHDKHITHQVGCSEVFVAFQWKQLLIIAL